MIDPIRVATIVPRDELKKIEVLISEFESTHQPRERRQYLLEYPGFSTLFGVRLVLGDGLALLQLPPDLEEEISQASQPHFVFGRSPERSNSSTECPATKFRCIDDLLAKSMEAPFFWDSRRGF